MFRRRCNTCTSEISSSRESFELPSKILLFTKLSSSPFRVHSDLSHVITKRKKKKNYYRNELRINRKLLSPSKHRVNCPKSAVCCDTFSPSIRATILAVSSNEGVDCCVTSPLKLSITRAQLARLISVSPCVFRQWKPLSRD